MWEEERNDRKMLEIANIRKEKHGEWTRLVADISFEGVDVAYEEKTIWFAVKNEHAGMLTDESYDAFVLVPLYLAMQAHTDLHICGPVSKRLYKNVSWYMQRILCNFSDALAPIKVMADGFTVVPEAGGLIGTGISCGVDSMSTIMDHFVKEDDPEYRLNSLFLVNCGTHGDFENPASRKLFLARFGLNKQAADEMGLPVYAIESNLHAFTHKIGEQKLGYFAIWSCILSVQRMLKKYYTSSAYSYDEILAWGRQSHDVDMAEFAKSYLVPLIRTEKMEFIVDGCQYYRWQKVLNIKEWEVAQRHLNVCVNSADGSNCCECAKCIRTIVPLEATGGDTALQCRIRHGQGAAAGPKASYAGSGQLWQGCFLDGNRGFRTYAAYGAAVTLGSRNLRAAGKRCGMRKENTALSFGRRSVAEAETAGARG